MTDVQSISLSNFGLLKIKIPEPLFNELRNECNTCFDNEELITGVSGTGTPKHFLMKDSSVLKSFALEVADIYFTTYHNAISWKIKSDGLDDARMFPLEPWINIQTNSQWIPPHDHSGILAYTVWVDIPSPSIFEIIYSTISGETIKQQIHLSNKDEGTMILFPSKLIHCVHPYNNDLTRISIAGNIILN